MLIHGIEWSKTKYKVKDITNGKINEIILIRNKVNISLNNPLIENFFKYNKDNLNIIITKSDT